MTFGDSQDETPSELEEKLREKYSIIPHKNDEFDSTLKNKLYEPKVDEYINNIIIEPERNNNFSKHDDRRKNPKEFISNIEPIPCEKIYQINKGIPKEIFDKKNFSYIEEIIKKVSHEIKKDKIPLGTYISSSIGDIKTPEQLREEQLKQEHAQDYAQYVETHGEIDPAYQDAWFDIAFRADMDQFLGVTPAQFTQVAQALQFAKQTGNDDEFYEGFRGALSEGNIEPWTKAILNYFKQSTIGGGNYGETNRTMEVGVS